MDNVLCPGEAAKWSIRMGADDGFTLPQLGVGRRGAMERNRSERTIFVQRHGAEVRLAYAGRVFQHRLEYRLKLARRAVDDLEYLRRRSLLLQAFAQLVEQARVLDGDDRLRGEIADKLNLLIGKGADFLAIDVDRTDQLVFFEHRDVDKSPGASQFEETGAHGIALVDRLGLDIGNLSRLFRRHHASERGPRYGTQEQVFSSLLDIRRWRIMVGDKAEGLSFAEIEC